MIRSNVIVFPLQTYVPLHPQDSYEVRVTRTGLIESHSVLPEKSIVMCSVVWWQQLAQQPHGNHPNAINATERNEVSSTYSIDPIINSRPLACER